MNKSCRGINHNQRNYYYLSLLLKALHILFSNLFTCWMAADEAVQISFGCDGLGRQESRHAVAVAVATMVRSPIDILDRIPKRAFMPLT